MKNKKNYIGRIARIQCRGFSVYVEILDYKSAYGRDRWLVEPLAGTGKGWIQDLRILPKKIADNPRQLFD